MLPSNVILPMGMPERSRKNAKRKAVFDVDDFLLLE
jgi:hypothetical protein